MVAIALGVLAVLMAANYFGLSVLTGWVGYLSWQLIRLALIVLVMGIFLLISIFKWLWKVVLWLWNLIF